MTTTQRAPLPTTCSIKALPKYKAPFPPLQISDAAHQVLRDATEAFLAEGVADFERFTQQHGADQRLPKAEFKLLRERDDMRVYLKRKTPDEMIGSDGQRSTIQTLVSVGQVPGSFADCLYGGSAPTLAHVRLKTACLRDSICNCAVVHVLEDPTPEDPYRTMSIRWYVHELPFPIRAFTRGRDATYMESTGIATFSTGERIGYHLLHSLSLPELMPVQEYHRFEFSTITLWRHHSEQRTEIFLKTFADLKEPPIALPLALRGLATSLLLIGTYAEAGRTKKLTWLLRHQAQRSFRSMEAVPLLARRCKLCCSCGRFLGRKHRSSKPHECALCGLAMCKACEIQRAVFALSEQDEVCRYHTRLCHPCWQRVLTADTDQIAAEEVLQLARHGNGSAGGHPVWLRVTDSVGSGDSNSTRNSTRICF